MTDERYREVAELAGPWRQGVYARPIPMEQIRRLRSAVGIYVACDGGGQVQYVGSAARPGAATGVADRVREHRSLRRGIWRDLWVIPLRDDTPRAVVHGIEGQIRDVLRPRQNVSVHRPRFLVSISMGAGGPSG